MKSRTSPLYKAFLVTLAGHKWAPFDEFPNPPWRFQGIQSCDDFINGIFDVSPDVFSNVRRLFFRVTNIVILVEMWQIWLFFQNYSDTKLD